MHEDEFLGILWIWKQHEWLSLETEPYATVSGIYLS